MRLRAQPRIASALIRKPMRTYYPDGQLMRNDDGDYYADPVNVAERLVRLIALHDNVKDPSAVTLQSDFNSLGLNVLDLQEILLQVEKEFYVELSEDDCESFHTVNDIVENLSRNFYTK
jgi:NADH dehydrogenase (ubiquinone) 1 alpha/beta subcomplex 1